MSPATIPLLSPAELGFPPKFQTWRDAQIRAIDQTIASSKRFVAATAPTGFGKSLYAVASALLHPEVRRALYLTGTKGLQDQLAGDFLPLGLCDVRGQRNYPCVALERGGVLDRYRRARGYVGCDEGPCHSGVRCPLGPSREEFYRRPDCPYYGAVHDAREATLVNTNYAFWLAQGAYGQGIGAFDFLVLDEADQAVDELEAFLTFTITTEDASHLRTRLLESPELQTWKDWAAHHYARLAGRLDELEGIPPADAHEAQSRRALKGTLGKLDRLRQIDVHDWILEPDTYRSTFSPMRVSRYAEQYLFQGVPRVLLMSATLTKKTLALLGIAETELEHLEFPSTFPVSRRPIIAVETAPAVRVNARMTDSAKESWMRRIDRYVEMRRDRKGLIQPVSYARAKELVKHSDHADLMIWHESGEAQFALEALKAHDGPCCLVTPSIVSGVDLPDDLCRYILVGKVPIPDTRGAIMEVRAKLDPEYVYYTAMRKLVQLAGRGMRHPLDWCEVGIVDDSFGDWFWNRGKKYAPRWFRDAVEFSNVMPEPLRF